jgi:hypothetical protein
MFNTECKVQSFFEMLELENYQAAFSRATLVVPLRLLSYTTAAVAFRQKGGERRLRMKMRLNESLFFFVSS